MLCNTYYVRNSPHTLSNLHYDSLRDATEFVLHVLLLRGYLGFLSDALAPHFRHHLAPPFDSLDLLLLASGYFSSR